MKKKTLSLMLLSSISFLNFSYGQNLVPNWSFEDTVSCPAGGGAINLAIGWDSYSHTPDYCNSCNAGFVSVPSNQWGYQIPKSGNAYAGLITYISFAPNYRECLGIQLSQPLIVGERYYASFYISMAYNIQGQRFGISSNKIGIKLSTAAYSSSNPIAIDNHAQVYSDSVVSDTTNWTRIEGNFFADSAYRFLSVGNFFIDSLTSILVYDTIATHSYYYIDDIRFSSDSNFVNEITERNVNTDIRVFPNPAKDWVEISGSNMQSIIIHDALGRLIYSKNNMAGPSFLIDTYGFADGAYILTILLNDHTTIYKKINIIN